MDLLAAALEKKRSALESTAGGAKKKYIRRGDLERQREQEYLAEQERERKEKEEKARKLAEEKEVNRKKEQAARLSSPSPSQTESPSDSTSSPTATPADGSSGSAEAIASGELAASSATFNIPPEEVVRRLRARGQPIRLFAETDQQRKIRLRALELMEDRSEGQRNDFMRALENAEAGLHMEALGKQSGKDSEKKKPKVDPTKDL
ncbi:mRNA splicing protein prp18, partial [Lobosporangium transversale]